MFASFLFIRLFDNKLDTVFAPIGHPQNTPTKAKRMYILVLE